VSDWFGEEPHDDEFPPPPEQDEDDPADAGADARPWGEWSVPQPEPGTGGIPRPEPGMGSIPRPEPAGPAGSRPEPGRGGIPSFARPEAELRAEFEARLSRRGSGGSAASAPDAGSAAPDTGAGSDGTPHHRRASRFQQMMKQYQRTQDGAPPPAPGQSAEPGGTAGPRAWGAGPAAPVSPPSGTGPATTEPADSRGTGGVARPGPGRSVDWSDDVPSEDDVTIEESGMAGRKVVERLLGARLVEERMLDGSPLS
jgi:DNA polymerase-3 subunit gamma/tau